MAASTNRFIERLNSQIENRFRPRDEAMAIRRLMALQLGETLGTEQVSQPLALVDADLVVKDNREIQGLHREYLEAVKRNVRARKEFIEARDDCEKISQSIQPAKESNNAELLKTHLRTSRLKEEERRLRITIRYLDQLDQMPAADPEFLNTETMFDECSPLPELPKEIMEGYTREHDGIDEETAELLRGLRKAVLRQKLQAKKESQRFEQSQSRGAVDPSALSPGAKLHALNAVKSHLIHWVETQLSKAGDDAEPESPGQGASGKHFDFESKLSDIETSYERHLQLRRSLLSLMARRDQLPPLQFSGLEHENKPEPSQASKAPVGEPLEAYMLTPYIEKLHALARQQKELLQEKSFINSAIARQQEETKLALDRLAEESQLLPKFPATRSSKPKLSFGEATRSANKISIPKQVEPWIYAADSAKIATLESVAEKVDEGQMAFEESMNALHEMRQLLNIKEAWDEPQPDQVNDTWLGEAEEGKERTATKQSGKKGDTDSSRTIWSVLDGNLGTLNE